jgi:hypothetical protein
MLHFWAFCAGGRAASPTRPSSCCAAAAVAPTRRLGLPPEHSYVVPRRCALGAGAGLAVWFVGPRMSGAAETAGGAPLLAAARRRLGGGGEGEKEG